MKEIFSRRSIRSYIDKDVSDNQVKELLRAAMYAPSAWNEFAWHFVVIRDRNTLNEISNSHPYAHMLLEAPLAIIPCCDTGNFKYDGVFWIQDMAAAIQNILLQAESMSLGTCWCGVYPRKELIDIVSQIVSLPDHIVPVAIIPVGYPGEKKDETERYKPDRIHNEKW